MKKLILLLLAVSLLSGCAATYDGPTTTELMLTERNTTFYYPDFDETWTDREVYSYDIYGNLASKQNYDNGELAWVNHYRYDDRGNQISNVYWDHSGLIPLPGTRMETTYDDQDRVLTVVYKNMWGWQTGKSTYTYDDAAHTSTWNNGTGDQITYYYDENGLCLRSVGITAAGDTETLNEYDDRGNQISGTETLNGEPFGSFEAEYDDQDRLLWLRQYDEDGSLFMNTTYLYDDEAHTITQRLQDGTVRTEYYDTEGRLQSAEERDSEGEVTRTEQYFYQEIRVPAETEGTP